MKPTFRFGLIAAATLACLSSSVLIGCGGGTTSTTPMGALTASVTDGPSDDYDHVWITIKSIAIHADANQVWNSNDATWQKYTLPAPITVDLANLTNGSLTQLFAGIQLPAGSYKQIRLFLAGFDDTLTTPAQTAGLTFNDQVDYTDSSSVVHHVPLEIANPSNGIPINGSFTLADGGSLNLVFDFDLEHDLVRFPHGTEDAFTLKPELRYFDSTQSGAIVGHLDTSTICTATPSSACTWNFIVKAETLSADGTRHVDRRATKVRSDGTFVLYPVAANTSYDILIRGRNAETMLIKNVSASAGSTPSAGATNISSAAIAPTLASGHEYFAQFQTALTPSSGWALFQQTLPGSSEVPYEVRWANTNPYTGLLHSPIALVNGPIHVASYNSGSALTFTTSTPQEASGGYKVVTRSLGYYDLSAPYALTSPGTNTVASPLLFTENQPAMSSTVLPGTVTGSIVQSTAGTYDRGQLVIARMGEIVATQDLQTVLAFNGGAGGAYSPVILPAGTSSSPVPGAYYYAYVRVWNAAHPAQTKRVVPINGYIDLRTSSSMSGLNLAL